MKKLIALGILTAGLASCDNHQSAVQSEKTPMVQPATVHRRAIDYTLEHRYEDGPADTLILLGSQHYRLRLQAETDSTRPVDYGPASGLGNAFAIPGDTAQTPERVRGYWGEYVFWLSDSTGRRTIFRQHVNKTAFYRAVPTDIAVVTPTDRPMYLGYSAALHALVFVVAIYPGAGDFGFEATLLLDATTGKVRHLGPAHSAVFAGLDCDPRLAPGGQAVLTCSELVRAGRPTLNLNNKPHARLVGARFLTDTTFVTMYEYGDYRPGPDDGSAPTLVVPPALRHAPNTFVRGLSGRVLGAFRAEWTEDFAIEMARLFVPATGTYYFFDDNTLSVIRQARPDSIRQIPFRRLPRFTPPKRRSERVDTLDEFAGGYVLYLDTLDARRIRYAKLPPSQDLAQ